MAVVEKKREEKEVSYFSPGALRWMALNGVDYRALFSSAQKHEDSASQFEKVLRRKSLKVCENELNGYLKEFRSAETELRKLASFLSDPDFKSKFLDENKDYSEASYDAAVANVRKKASYCQNAAWAYEKAYAKKYGARQEYSTHLLVRDVARQLREEMEKAAGSTPSPAYKRAPERAAFAQNTRAEPVTRETHALVSRFMQDLQKKYGEEPSEKGETRIARAENSGYRRGGRAGMAYINAAAARRDEEERGAYHRGERRILSEREQVMIARRDVPRKSEEELLAGEARISKAKGAPRSIAQMDKEKTELKAERIRLDLEFKKKKAKLSDAEKKEKSKEIADLTVKINALRAEKRRALA